MPVFVIVLAALGVFAVSLSVAVALAWDWANKKMLLEKKSLIPGSEAFQSALEEEKKKLGLEDAKIDIIYQSKEQMGFVLAAARKIDKNIYQCRFRFDDLYGHSIIRHELWHIYAGHCDALLSPSTGIFAGVRKFFGSDVFDEDEFTADVYGAFGVRLWMRKKR